MLVYKHVEELKENERSKKYDSMLNKLNSNQYSYPTHGKVIFILYHDYELFFFVER